MGRGHKVNQDRPNCIFPAQIPHSPSSHTKRCSNQGQRPNVRGVDESSPTLPKNRRAIHLLVKISKRKAQEVTSHTDRRRAQREQARAQRVATEEKTPQEGGAEEVQPERVQAEAAAPQRVETTLTTENEASEPPPSLIPEDDDSLHSAYSEASIQG